MFGKKSRRASGAQVRETMAGYGFIAPNFLGFLVFVSIPIVVSFYFSFTDYQVLKPPTWAGLQNYKDILGFHYEDVPVFKEIKTEDGDVFEKEITREVVAADGTVTEEVVTERKLKANDPNFWKYCYNTVFLMMGIPLGITVSLSMALIMNQKIRGITFWRTVFFLPSVTAGVAIYILWTQIYSPEQGLLNQFLNATLGYLGLFPEDPTEWPRWIGDARWAKPSLILMGLWVGAGGYTMILYLAALQGVDPQLYEAAMIDGASHWQKFRHITWPLISPTTFFIVIMGVIGGFQGGFQQAYVMTGGGPQGSTTTLSYYIFNNAYAWFNMGKAASIAWFLFVVVFVLTLVNWRFGGKKVNY
ncbi:MAG: carbohydrate ABC transporter permease [Planctomycetota bacterium]|jgi:multiple sugar transport system permease protein